MYIIDMTQMEQIEKAKKHLPYKRLAIDFDGTLFDDEGSIDFTYTNNIHLKPKEDASVYTKLLKSRGYEILIYTCRPDYHRKYLEEQLKLAKISYDYILFYTKPRVDKYIDDKAITFTTWEKVFEDLKFMELSDMGLQQPFNTFEKVLQKEKVRYGVMHGYIDEKSKIIDIGCGDGSVFDGTKYTVDGFDVNKLSCQLAATSPNYKNVFNKFKDIDFSKYNLITLFGVLEHLDRFAAVNLLKRLLKQRINMFITVPNAESFHRHFGFHLGKIGDLQELGVSDYKIGHKQYYNVATLMQQILSIPPVKGFYRNDDVRKGTLGFKFGTNEQMADFKDKHNALFDTAYGLNQSGENIFNGCELFAYVKINNDPPSTFLNKETYSIMNKKYLANLKKRK